MPDPLRIGLIGAGGNARRRHIPGFKQVDGLELVAVCNRSRESGQRIADEFGVSRVETDPQAIFAADDIDAVCIGTWPYRHREYTVRALEAGKHVLCEARMAMNATEAREMLAAAQAHPDLVAQIVPGPYDLRSWRTIRRLVADGTLGDIREVHVNQFGEGSLNADAPLHWREQTEFSGTNTMVFGILAEVVTRWLGPTGRVIADGAVFVTERRDDQGATKPIDVPDSLGVFAELERGGRVTYRLSTVTHAPRDANGIAVYGSRGTLHWDSSDTMSFAPLGEAPQPLEPDAGTAGSWRVEQDFADSIRDGAPVELTNFTDGVHYMRVTEAVARSRAEGRAVAIDEV